MEEKIKQFKEFWNINHNYIPMILTNKQIISFINDYKTTRAAVTGAINFCLNNEYSELYL